MKAPYLVIGILVAVATGLAGFDWRTGLTFALVCIYLAFSMIHLEWGIYIIVAAAVIFIDGWNPKRDPEEVFFRLALGRVYIMEIAVYGLVLIYALKRNLGWVAVRQRTFLSRTPLDTPLMVFALLLPFFAFYGLVLGNPLLDALGYMEWRSLFTAIVFYFLLTTIISTREKALRLFWWFLALDTVIGLYSLALYALRTDGPLPALLGAGPVGEGPMNYTFAFAALGGISWLLYCKGKDPWNRRFLMLAVAVPVVNILVSEKRSAQIGLFVGLIVLTWKIPFWKRLKWGVTCAGAALVILLFVRVLGTGEQSTGLGKSASRYTEVVEFVRNGELTHSGDDDLGFHLFDFVDSFNSVRLRPILGYGFGGQFQRELTSLVGGDLIEPGIVHDQYLDFCVKMGLLGLLAFLWVLFRFLSFSHKAIWRTPVLEHEAISLGLRSAICGDMALEVWMSNWRGNTQMPIVFFLSFALVVCLLRNPRRELAKLRLNERL
jgi:hypothetical protein